MGKNTKNSTTSACMRVSRLPYGKRRDGYIEMIRMAGSSGIADIGSGEDARMTLARFADGRR
jgi:hypothetical protein